MIKGCMFLWMKCELTTSVIIRWFFAQTAMGLFPTFNLEN